MRCGTSRKHAESKPPDLSAGEALGKVEKVVASCGRRMGWTDGGVGMGVGDNNEK